MTAEQIDQQQPGVAEGALVIATPTVDHSNDLVPFQLQTGDEVDPTVLYAVRPKKAKMIKVVQGLSSLDTLSDLEAAGTLDHLMRLVLDPESLAYVEARFEDDDDDLDVDALTPILETLVGLWYGRPTGPQRGSRVQPPRTGPPSTVRRR